jgi:hypothetical protein
MTGDGDLLRDRRRMREARLAVGWLHLARPVDTEAEEYASKVGNPASVFTEDAGFRREQDYASPGGPDTVSAFFVVPGRRWWPEVVWSVQAGNHAQLNAEPEIREQGRDRGVVFRASPIAWRWAHGDHLSGVRELEYLRARLKDANRRRRISVRGGAD